MQITNELIESLLWPDEGTTLDFKKEQYLFTGASDVEKSELLKDVLAFANAFRREDAFILLGAEDVQGGRGNVVGVSPIGIKEPGMIGVMEPVFRWGKRTSRKG